MERNVEKEVNKDFLNMFDKLNSFNKTDINKRAEELKDFQFVFTEDIELESEVEKAYRMFLESKLPAIFIYDNRRIMAITKERSLIELTEEKLQDFVQKLKNDQYYSTIFCSEEPQFGLKEVNDKFDKYKREFGDKFKRVYGGKYRFGTIAVRADKDGFLTTARGKSHLDDISVVKNVDHELRQILTYGTKKATLNAPLLSNIFKNNDIDVIVHYHEMENLPELEYAVPGTVRDSDRDIKGSFNIKYHGCYLLFDINGNIIR